MSDSPSKKVRETSIEHYQIMMPHQGNPGTTVNGGVILNLIDKVAGICVLRHCRNRAVTASIDAMQFLHPVHVGDLLIIKAQINWVGHTSLEVGVSVEVEDLHTGERYQTGNAYLTFVAVDDNGKPKVAPKIVPETTEEKQRYEDAILRRELRLKNKELLMKKAI